MEHLEGILRLTDNELKAIEDNGKYKSKDEIDAVYKLIDIAKDIYCIWEYEDGMGEMDGMSYADGPYNGMSNRGGRGGSYRGGSYGGSYDGGSYARGRGRNAKRDSMGRYSSNRGGNYRMYSREDGKSEYIENLRDMMEEAPDEQTRQEIQRMIQKMENA